MWLKSDVFIGTGYRNDCFVMKIGGLYYDIGQRQQWFFFLRLINDDKCISLIHRLQLIQLKFDQWRLVKYWYPVNNGIKFKRRIDCRVLKELFEFLPP